MQGFLGRGVFSLVLQIICLFVQWFLPFHEKNLRSGKAGLEVTLGRGVRVVDQNIAFLI